MVLYDQLSYVQLSSQKPLVKLSSTRAFLNQSIVNHYLIAF